MKVKKVLFATIFVLLIFPISTGFSYATQSAVTGVIEVPPPLPMTVTTDKMTYSDGDKIIVSGTVRDLTVGTAVTIKIRSPNNNLVTVGQSTLAGDNTFSTTFTTGGNLWQEAGKYEIVAKIGNKDAVTTFQFGGYIPFTFMHVDGTDISISYKIVGGQLLKILADIQSKSLVLSIKATDDGYLTIVLPRELIDSQSNGLDTPFSVMVDGKIVDHKEQSTSNDRTLFIPFVKGSSEIIISGTKIIPEFGAIAVLVFTMAILSTLLVFSRNGNKLKGF